MKAAPNFEVVNFRIWVEFITIQVRLSKNRKKTAYRMSIAVLWINMMNLSRWISTSSVGLFLRFVDHCCESRFLRSHPLLHDRWFVPSFSCHDFISSILRWSRHRSFPRQTRRVGRGLPLSAVLHPPPAEVQAEWRLPTYFRGTRRWLRCGPL